MHLKGVVGRSWAPARGLWLSLGLGEICRSYEGPAPSGVYPGSRLEVLAPDSVNTQ